jgi:hypothetical protein
MDPIIISLLTGLTGFSGSLYTLISFRKKVMRSNLPAAEKIHLSGKSGLKQKI